MKKIKILIIGLLLLAAAAGCKKDSDFLNNSPYSLLTDKQAYGSLSGITSILGGLYASYVDFQTITNWGNFTLFDEGYASGGNGNVQMTSNYPYGNPNAVNGPWFEYQYNYVRGINLFIQLCGATSAIADSTRKQLIAEAKFLRAAYYFEMVKREGGVPLIFEPLTYDNSGKVNTLLYPRKKESEIYDFIINTMDTLKDILPKSTNGSLVDRASRGVCLAMETRAALYAGSIAKYGANTPTVSLPGGEVGIPVSQANGYYQKALAAAQELMADKSYSLYMKNPGDLAGNFSNIFLDKSANPEVIFVQNFQLKALTENWTLNNQPHAGTEEPATNGNLNPSLNLAMQYEMLNNTYQPFQTTDAGGNYIYYSNISDIFKGRDARLAATFILPGDTWKGNSVDIWAGYMLGNGSIITSGTYGGLGTLPGQSAQVPVVGQSGPINGLVQTAETGFYVRKYLDPTPLSGTIGSQSAVWWVRYRYAEVLLNAAEAAFELSQKDLAVQYINQVRARAGLTTPLTADQITFDRIVHERRVELAFEGHEFFDNKRWRIADKVWNGQAVSYSQLASNIGAATAPNTQIYAIYPYHIYNPDGAHDGQWVFKIVKPSKVTGSYNFALGNYYSQFSANVISSNPLLVQNPNQ